MHPVTASPPYERAIRSLADLLGKLRVDHIFLGGVARSAHMGDRVEGGSVDAVALLGPPQKNQVATMAVNRGFDVDREEVDASEELDLIPLKLNGIRLHVLVASNALYGQMIGEGVAASMGEIELRVPRVEDFALLLQLNSDVTALMRLTGTPAFDLMQYNRKLVSIGLGEMVIPE